MEYQSQIKSIKVRLTMVTLINIIFLGAPQKSPSPITFTMTIYMVWHNYSKCCYYDVGLVS